MIENAAKLPEMEPVMVEHKELKLIGIPCIGLTWEASIGTPKKRCCPPPNIYPIS